MKKRYYCIGRIIRIPEMYDFVCMKIIWMQITFLQNSGAMVLTHARFDLVGDFVCSMSLFTGRGLGSRCFKK